MTLGPFVLLGLAVLAGVVGEIITLASHTAATASKDAAQKQIDKLRDTLEIQFAKPSDKTFIPLVFSTSASVDSLRKQISDIGEQVRNQKYEIVASKIDPVLEATLKASLDNLIQRIETLERNQLSKWDLVSVSFKVLSAIGGVVLIFFEVLKRVHS